MTDLLNPKDYDATARALQTNWDVYLPATLDAPSDWDILLEALEERILDLLLRKPDRLMSALYLLDISEQRFAQAMDQPTMEDRAHDIAHAVLERESEKIRARREYAESRASATQRKTLPDTQAPE